MDNPGLQPPMPTPQVIPPPVPPVPPTPEPVKEEPIIQTPPNPTIKKAKKFLPKLAVGTLVMALLIGGLVLGKNLLLQQQRPVEKLAVDCGAQDCNDETEVCCLTGCKPASEGCGDNPPPGGETCSNESPTVTDCRGQVVGYQFCFQGSSMKCIKTTHVADDIWHCGQQFGGSACPSPVPGGVCDNSSVTAVYCRGKAVGYVIDSNWTLDCPDLTKEPGKIYELYCYNTSGTLCSAICREKSGPGDSCGDGCVKYLCPYGDTDSDGKCGESDYGVSWNFYEGAGCPNITCGSNECCQIDYTQDNTYCGFKELAWNCTPLTPPPSSPPASPSPSPSPSASCTIQGYKVIMPGNQKIEPASSQAVRLAGEETRTANPYYFNGVSAGSKTVSVSTPDGYTVGYTLCINNVNCHNSSATPGSSVTFDCPAGNYPADGYADLWWHFRPIAPTLACVGLQKDKTAPTLGDQVTYTCEGTFSAGDLAAFFRYSSDGGVTFSSPEPITGVPVDPTTHNASHNITVHTIGSWVVQCKVCTISPTTPTCTTWGQAN